MRKYTKPEVERLAPSLLKKHSLGSPARPIDLIEPFADVAVHGWFVIRVTPGLEGRAVAGLALVRWHAFIPQRVTLRRPHRRARKRVEKLVPLCAGYLIARPDYLPGNWLDMSRAPHVFGVLGNEHGPYRMDGPNAAKLYSPDIVAMDKGLSVNRSSDIEAGDKCDITDGPFQHLEVTVSSYDGTQVFGFIDILGGQTPVEIHEDFLRKK